MGAIGKRKGFAKTANQVDTWWNSGCIFGIMGGLRPTVGMSAVNLNYDSATNKIVSALANQGNASYIDPATGQVVAVPAGLPTFAGRCNWAAAYAYMQANGLLSSNPACSAATGRKHPIPQCRCCPQV